MAALARGGRINFLGFVLRLAARLPFLFIAGRMYGAEALGRFAYAVLIVEFAAQLATLGLKRGLAEQLAKTDKPHTCVVWDALLVAATLPLEEWFRGFLTDEGTLAVPRPPTRSKRDWYRELQQFENELHDLMAEALGYPVYAPGEPGYSPDRPEYVTGDHTGMTLAMEAATKLRTLRERGLL